MIKKIKIKKIIKIKKFNITNQSRIKSRVILNQKFEKEIKNLSDYTWGLGIEHEMHLFHQPSKEEDIKNVTLFDGESAMKRTMKAYKEGKLKMSDEEYKFMKSVPFESTGRLCNGQWVIKKVPFNMPEFITWEPFCNIRQQNTINEYIDKVVQGRQIFINIISREPVTKDIIEKNGDLIQYPAGMTRYLKCPKNGSTPNYSFFKKKGSKDEIVRPEYVGSYHVTMTLPYTENTSQKAFIEMHQNYASQLQWLEPLLLTSYFSQDQYACGSKEDRVRGSFRVMIIGWGNFAGSDVRLFAEGIGRYSKSRIHWRKGLKLYEHEKIKPCISPSPSAIAEGAITTLSSDFRTFGSTDPLRPEHRQSGIGMTKPNGIEFRIFDHFQDGLYIESLVHLLGIVAENSRVTKCNKYVYKNKYWIDAMHQIMKHGYKAQVSRGYINLLSKMLGIKIITKSLNAYDLFENIVLQLYKKNYYGNWNKIFNHNIILKELTNKNEPIGVQIPQLNKISYILSLCMKLNRKKLLLKAFNNLSTFINTHLNKMIDFKTYQSYVKKYMGSVWVKEADDILYFYGSNIDLIKNDNGTIHSFTLINELPIYKNMNKEILSIYSENENNKYYIQSLLNFVKPV